MLLAGLEIDELQSIRCARLDQRLMHAHARRSWAVIQRVHGRLPDQCAGKCARRDAEFGNRHSGSGTVRGAPSGTIMTAIARAGSVALALSAITWWPRGGSKNVSPTCTTRTGSPASPRR